MEAEALSRKYYSIQEFWNVLNFGFLFDYGLFYCGFNQILFQSFDWAYLALIDPYWYTFFTPEYQKYEAEKIEK